MAVTDATVASSGRTRPTTPPRKARAWRLASARVAIPLAALLIWQLVAPTTDLVPTPGESISMLYNGFATGWIYEGLAATAAAVGAGFGLGAAAALALGYLLGRSRITAAIFEPMVTGTFAVPRVIVYPILLAIYGVGVQAETGMVAISAFFPILMSTAAAVRNVNPSLLKLGRSFNASQLQVVCKIVVPEAAPGIMVGIRIGFSIAFVAAIIAELFASKAGLGMMISQAYAHLDLPRMYALVLLVMVAAFIGNMLLWWAERRLRRA